MTASVTEIDTSNLSAEEKLDVIIEALVEIVEAQAELREAIQNINLGWGDEFGAMGVEDGFRES